MKQIIFLILLSSFLFSCRTKQRSVSFIKEGRTEVERVKIHSFKEVVKKEEVKKITDQVKQVKKDDFSGDIIIKGKSDSLTPLEYHNIIGKDTLQSITIKGNAEFTINNHYQKSSENSKQIEKEETTNIIQDLAKTAVSKETIKDVASTVSQKTKEITSKGFQGGFWIVFAILGAIIIIVGGIYLYLKKYRK